MDEMWGGSPDLRGSTWAAYGLYPRRLIVKTEPRAAEQIIYRVSAARCYSGGCCG